MRSNSSKPSSDAGLQAIGMFSTQVALITKATPEGLGFGVSSNDKQTAVACQQSNLAGRHRPPTRGPTQWGGEGTTSREVVECMAVFALRA